ncbi:MAG: leucine-rich repeat domain-containing protein [Oscillospiraceae bacterium]|nr:leucine-rich repeat domain-containing protein [Oscillospiraceae bacterium]
MKPNAFVIQNGILVKYHGDAGAVTVPEGVTAIGDSAFAGCTGLTAVTIPDRVRTIRSRAFLGCTGLTSILLPSTITRIEGEVFSRCSGLTEITIPDKVTFIGGQAFRSCTGLRSVRIPDRVTEIRGEAFSGCSGLTSVLLPHSVAKIGRWAFSGCNGLKQITIRSIRFDEGKLSFLKRRWEHLTYDDIIYGLITYDYNAPFLDYNVCTAFAISQKDEKNTAYVRNNLDRLLFFMIAQNEAEMLFSALKCDWVYDYFKEHIDECIENAISNHAQDVQLLLTNYKAEKLGYADPTDHLQL